MISKNILFAWNSNSNFADPFAFCWPNKYENGAKWKCLMRQFSCKIGGMKVVRGKGGRVHVEIGQPWPPRVLWGAGDRPMSFCGTLRRFRSHISLIY